DRVLLFIFPTIPLPPTPPLFPYTTLFRSLRHHTQIHPLSGNQQRTDSCITHETRCFRKRRVRANRPHVAAHHHSQGPQDCAALRSEEHTSELQSRFDLVCRLLLEKKKHT